MNPKGKKILVGVGVGCVDAIALFVGGCVAFVVWINAPGETIEPEQLLGDDTTGYARWVLRTEDPGTALFATKLIELSQTDPDDLGDDIPQALRNALIWNQNRNNDRNIRKLFPLVVVWAARPDAAAERERHLFGINPTSAGHQLTFVDWILRFAMATSPDVETHRHQGERIWWVPTRKDRGFALFIRQSSLFVAFDVDTAKQAVDRIRAGSGPGSDGALTRLFASLPDRPLRGAVLNRADELGRLLTTLLPAQIRMPGQASLETVDALTGLAGLWDEQATATVWTETADGLRGDFRVDDALSVLNRILD